MTDEAAVVAVAAGVVAGSWIAAEFAAGAVVAGSAVAGRRGRGRGCRTVRRCQCGARRRRLIGRGAAACRCGSLAVLARWSRWSSPYQSPSWRALSKRAPMPMEPVVVVAVSMVGGGWGASGGASKASVFGSGALPGATSL